LEVWRAEHPPVEKKKRRKKKAPIVSEEPSDVTACTVGASEEEKA
jgi:hypothetical protein